MMIKVEEEGSFSFLQRITYGVQMPLFLFHCSSSPLLRDRSKYTIISFVVRGNFREKSLHN